MNEWVSCKELKPLPFVDVLVYCSDTKEQMVAFIADNNNYQFAVDETGNKIYCDPDFWQPTPPPPTK